MLTLHRVVVGLAFFSFSFLFSFRACVIMVLLAISSGTAKREERDIRREGRRESAKEGNTRRIKEKRSRVEEGKDEFVK